MNLDELYEAAAQADKDPNRMIMTPELQARLLELGKEALEVVPKPLPDVFLGKTPPPEPRRPNDPTKTKKSRPTRAKKKARAKRARKARRKNRK